MKDLAVEIAQSAHSGNYLVEMAGELIAESARYNVWCYSRKSRSSAAELWNMAAYLELVCESCTAAWERYLVAKERDSGLDELLGVLRTAVVRLSTARVSDRVDFDDPSMPAEVRDWD